LEEFEPDRVVFLAIPENIYQKMQKIPFLQKALNRYTVRIVTFDPILEEIRQWQLL
jgi:XisH protein